uniref:Uncharacterized protein n=1 Tax=Anguilla anguilla TaxID=7936 RepID=A0A0E9TU22_ANGAN
MLSTELNINRQRCRSVH